MEETIISTRKIYSGRIVNLELHEVVLPDGKLGKREQIYHPGAAAVVALDEQQNILLVRQFRLAAKQITIEIPAGTLYPEEPPEECAAREMQEETGYKPGLLEPLGGFFVAPGYTTEYIHLFLATQLIPSSLTGDQDEFIEVLRMSFDDALRMIDAGEIIDGKTMTGILRVARKLGL
ncbi:MAG TPA: NUDIX hydrolase [Phototrophicaceae bacterium]|jgi:ADP-ribose pyrophosphatase|nr:NUDIX hydrolase [Phototrophicaceae bacterium]